MNTPPGIRLVSRSDGAVEGEPDDVNSLAMSGRARVLFVVTTETTGDRTRIISARKATRHEQRTYATAR